MAAARSQVRKPGKIFIGTSGFTYKSWNAAFYPKGLVKRLQLEFYASQFPAVEINATFYRLPSEKMVRGWASRVPREFKYALKGSRFITHMKKLANLGDGLDNYFQRIRPMQSSVGVILWQLPPTLQKDLPRLEAFLRDVQPYRYRHAVEFRHQSWYEDNEVFDLLRRYEATSAPSRAYAIAAARPIPESPPVIRAFRPARRPVPRYVSSPWSGRGFILLANPGHGCDWPSNGGLGYLVRGFSSGATVFPFEDSLAGSAPEAVMPAAIPAAKVIPTPLMAFRREITSFSICPMDNRLLASLPTRSFADLILKVFPGAPAGHPRLRIAELFGHYNPSLAPLQKRARTSAS